MDINAGKAEVGLPGVFNFTFKLKLFILIGYEFIIPLGGQVLAPFLN